MDLVDMKHQYFKLVMDGRLCMAPIGDKPERILDLGTGSGDWCVDMARQYPSACLLGTDLSNIKQSNVPCNVIFEIEDFDDEWSFEYDYFDLVHHRFNMTAVSNWPRQFQKAFDVLRPEGWIEVMDVGNQPQSDDKSIPKHSQLVRFFELVTYGCSQVGKDLRAPLQWRTQLQEAGYVEIQERMLRVPIGDWPRDPRLKEAGLLKLECLQELLRTIAPGFFARVLRWGASDIDFLFDRVKKELDDKSIHWWLPMHIMWAQKPLRGG